MKQKVKLLHDNTEGKKGQEVIVDDARGCFLTSHTMAEFVEYVKDEPEQKPDPRSK